MSRAGRAYAPEARDNRAAPLEVDLAWAGLGRRVGLGEAMRNLFGWLGFESCAACDARAKWLDDRVVFVGKASRDTSKDENPVSPGGAHHGPTGQHLVDVGFDPVDYGDGLDL